MTVQPALETEDWEIIGSDWWRTSFCDVPWSYISGSSAKLRRKSFHGPLVYIPKEHSLGDENESVNPELSGAKTALDAVVAYERDVGFYTPLLDLRLDERKTVNWNREADGAELLAAAKKVWDGLLDDLMNGPVLDDSDDSSLSSSVEFHRSVSVFSSLSSVDSIGLPTTPKAKSVFADVEIKDISPSGSIYFPLSPTRSLNAAASSFVPTFCSHLNDEPEEQPKPIAESFSNFTFPTLNANTPTPRTKKDDQFFSDGASPDGLLPPFMQDLSSRSRNRKSRTREIVDRLRSRMTPPYEPLSQTAVSLSPTPGAADTSFPAPQLSVSEDGGDAVSRLPSPCEEEDGWIDISQPNMPSPGQKNKRARELLFALTRRRTDSLTNENNRRIAAESVSQHSASSPPPASHPIASTDGWVERSPKPPTELPKKAKPGPNHARKKSANNASRTSSTSTNHSHSHSLSHSHLQPPQGHPSFPSTGYPPHTSSNGALPHLLPPQMLPPPYFFPAYPSVGVPTMAAYSPFMQMPAYHLAMSMQATQIPTPAAYAMGPTLGMPPQAVGAQMKHAGGSGNVPPFRSKNTPVW